MEHFYRGIKGWFNWPEMYERAARLAPKKATFVEIGCYLGKSTACLAVEVINSGKDIDLVCIDLWDPANKIGCTVEQFYATLKPLGKAIKIHTLQGDSVEAADLFKEGSVDFVWVDGDHRYPKCLQDIQAWWPKLKEGGWMGGDDLIFPGVRQALEEFFGPECAHDRDPRGLWTRFQSATCHYGKAFDIRPASGGWVWWTRTKTDDWTPIGLVE